MTDLKVVIPRLDRGIPKERCPRSLTYVMTHLRRDLLKEGVMTNITRDKIVADLASYFLTRPEVAMAFLFGSWAKGTTHEASDMDVAVYFDRDVNDDEESAVWSDVEQIAGVNVDFIVLNRAFPLIADSALRGIPIIIKDRGLYLAFFSRTISEAIDYGTFLESYWQLKQRRAHAS